MEDTKYCRQSREELVLAGLSEKWFGRMKMEKKTIGSFIAVLRKANGLTQKQLAQMLQVTDKTVSRWERDENLPDLTLIPVIAEIFGITSDELLRGERKSPNAAAATGQKEIDDGFQKRETKIGGSEGLRGEKQIQRILAAAKTKYLRNSMVSVFVGVSGALLAIGLRSLPGDALGAIAVLGAAIYQIINAVNSFNAIADEEFDIKSVTKLKEYIVDKTALVINVLIVCLTVVLICFSVISPVIDEWAPIVAFCVGGFCLSYVVRQMLREQIKV